MILHVRYLVSTYGLLKPLVSAHHPTSFEPSNRNTIRIWSQNQFQFSEVTTPVVNTKCYLGIRPLESFNYANTRQFYIFSEEAIGEKFSSAPAFIINFKATLFEFRLDETDLRSDPNSKANALIL